MKILMSRKFIIALLIVIISAIALFMKIIDGNVWTISASIAAGIYSATNILQPKFMPIVEEEDIGKED